MENRCKMFKKKEDYLSNTQHILNLLFNKFLLKINVNNYKKLVRFYNNFQNRNNQSGIDSIVFSKDRGDKDGKHLLYGCYDANLIAF